ncbi:MAG TPA: plasmid partitioning protein RepB C-terminal domain-containing protein [Phycisphaerae bacterium]|nr:plasmid partitioning protein RepB C-terminal domain-containing protein [Phycisphaerae bacterium]HRW53119.1 plasmid partitioning protein RepB C-terminal domain-containing protein [Phycisphaerae bacterium]
MAFDPEGTVLPLDLIYPLKKLTAAIKQSARYRRIVSSIQEIGIIEPLVVFPQNGRTKGYILLDGTIRYEVLKEIGKTEAFCLVATEDEAYTYNHKVNQVTPIQEHFMILRAIENGVSEERIATTLNVDVSNIRSKRDLLKGVCPEAVNLLKDRRASAGALKELSKAKPMRQIEMAELMIASGNLGTSYAKCLIAATSEDQLADKVVAKAKEILSPDEIARMEREMDNLSKDFRQIEETHGRNVLNLVTVVAYLRKLLENRGVVRFLSKNHADMLGEFQKIVESTSLADSE